MTDEPSEGAKAAAETDAEEFASQFFYDEWLPEDMQVSMKRLADSYRLACRPLREERDYQIQEGLKTAIALMKSDEDNAKLRERVAELEHLEAEAWGIRFCCNGADCACEGKPVDPPSWWQPDMAKRIAELESENARLKEHIQVLTVELQALKHGGAPL